MSEHPTDEWIRIHIGSGDLIAIPKGIYHRFMLDELNEIVGLRLWKVSSCSCKNKISEPFPTDCVGRAKLDAAPAHEGHRHECLSPKIPCFSEEFEHVELRELVQLDRERYRSVCLVEVGA